MMMNIILAGSLLVLSKASSFAVDGADTACDNYVQDGGYLKPVGLCWYDNTDADDISDYSYSWYQPTMFICEEDSYGDRWAVEYQVGASCNAGDRKVPTNTSYSCMGGNDTCLCTPGGNPKTNCDFYEETDYDWKWGSGFRIICDLEEYTTTRYVVNMCIDDPLNYYAGLSYYDGYSKEYSCGLSGYNYDYTSSKTNYNSYCSTGSPTASPTARPTRAPIDDGETTVTLDDGALFCQESTCAGVDGPRADRGNTFSILVGALIVAVNTFIFS